MPDEIKDVKPVSSPGSVKDGSQPSGDDLVKDNERLKGALSSLQAERDELREKADRYDEIEKRRELTAREEAERRRIENKQDNLDDQIEDLRRNPQNKAFFTYFEREIAKATKIGEESGSMKALMELAADYVEDMAEKESMKDTELLKALKPFLGQYEKKNPYRKVQLAYKAWQEQVEFKKKKDELAKKEAELNGSKENGTRAAREYSSVKDAMDSGNRSEARKMLGIMNKVK